MEQINDLNSNSLDYSSRVASFHRLVLFDGLIVELVGFNVLIRGLESRLMESLVGEFGEGNEGSGFWTLLRFSPLMTHHDIPRDRVF